MPRNIRQPTFFRLDWTPHDSGCELVAKFREGEALVCSSQPRLLANQSERLKAEMRAEKRQAERGAARTLPMDTETGSTKVSTSTELVYVQSPLFVPANLSQGSNYGSLERASPQKCPPTGYRAPGLLFN